MTSFFAAGGIILCNLLLWAMTMFLVKRSISRLTTTARMYFQSTGTDPKGNPLPSEFAGLVDASAQILAARITASIKANLLALNSAAVRQDQAAAKEALTASAPPLIGALLNSGVGKGLLRKAVKNPELAGLAMNFLGNMGAKGGNNGDQPPPQSSMGIT